MGQRIEPSEPSASAANLLLPGVLDDMTIMRYAHIHRHRASGGVEQHLRQLNQALLERHRMTVLQMHLVREGAGQAVEIEPVGLGRIVWVPVDFQPMDNTIRNLPRRIGYICRQSVRVSDKERNGQLLRIFSAIQRVASHREGLLRYGATILSEPLSHLLRTRLVDLLAVHWFSYDTSALIRLAQKARVPFVVINHFDNAQLSRPTARKWIARAAAVGGISERGVPAGSRKRYFNLSTAVDADFFSPEKAHPMTPSDCPIILLPARIGFDKKGHRDLIEAARYLLTRQVEFKLCFAGAVDSEPLRRDLESYAAGMGLDRRIVFLGDLSRDEIRNWYAISSVVVLPSYSEGLSRVLLEAQAMKKPVVAYDCGGMSEAVLPDETGFLTEKGNVKALADKLAFVLENEAARRKMGELGRNFVLTNFSVPALVQRHEIFYLGALAAARARRNGRERQSRHVTV